MPYLLPIARWVGGFFALALAVSNLFLASHLIGFREYLRETLPGKPLPEVTELAFFLSYPGVIVAIGLPIGLIYLLFRVKNHPSAIFGVSLLTNLFLLQLLINFAALSLPITGYFYSYTPLHAQ